MQAASTSRRLLRRALAVVLLAILAVGTATGTTYEETVAACPSCTKAFKVVRVTGTNTYGGVDADGCATANGGPPGAFLFEACPHCLCARFPLHRDREPKGEAARDFLRQAAEKRPFPAEASQHEIPSWRKYELGIGLLEAEGAPAGMIAGLWLRAAWTLRGETRAALLHSEGRSTHDALDLLHEEDGERQLTMDRTAPGARTRAGREIRAALAMRSALAGDDARLSRARLYAAVVLCVHGEIATAEPEVESLATGDDEATAAIVKRLQEQIGRECDYLRRCLAALGEASDPGKLSAQAAWIASECRRRLGDDEAAARLVERALPELPVETLVLLRDAAEWAGEATPKWRGAVGRAWTQRMEALGAQLADIDEAEDAASALGRIADPAVRPQLVSLLSGEDETATAFAATALAGYEPGDGTVRLLEDLAKNPEADVDVRARSMETLAAWGRPSSAEVFRAALGEPDDEYLFEAAVLGLGFTGEPRDVKAILLVDGAAPESALTALSVLAGQEFESLGAFRKWEMTYSDGRTWVPTALRRAGVEAEKLDDRKAVPELIPLLTHRSLPVRWNAFRRLRTITGETFGSREVRYVGRFRTPKAPNEDPDLEDILGEGWVVTHRSVPAFDLDDMGDVVQPMRDEDGRNTWRIAKAHWDAWWDTQ